MRLRKLLILFLIILFVVLQSTALNYVRIFNAKPDILLILVTFFSLYFGKIYGLFVGVACGIFSEATSGLPTGVLVVGYSLGGLVVGHLGKIIYARKPFGQMGICFIFSLALYLLLFIIFQILSPNLSFFEALIIVILPTAFYTAFVAPFLFHFLKIIFSIQ